MSNEVPAGWYPNPDPSDPGSLRWWDGAKWGAVQTGHTFNGPDHNQNPKKALIAVLSALGIGILVLSILTFGVERWIKTVEPEVPNSFRTEQIPTGEYSVTVEESPICFSQQDWWACVNSHIDQYNYACAERILATQISADLCDRYWEMIADMQTRGGETGWTYVEVPPNWGRLMVTEGLETVKISNNDGVPAVTREAVCVLWVFVECEWHSN